MEPREAPRRLTNLYAVGVNVEVFLPDEEWHRGKIVRHEHPGVWVETENGSRWFVTNGGKIRAAGED